MCYIGLARGSAPSTPGTEMAAGRAARRQDDERRAVHRTSRLKSDATGRPSSTRHESPDATSASGESNRCAVPPRVPSMTDSLEVQVLYPA